MEIFVEDLDSKLELLGLLSLIKALEGN